MLAAMGRYIIILVVLGAGSLGVMGQANAGMSSTEVDTSLQEAAELMNARRYEEAAAAYTRVLTEADQLEPTTKMSTCVKRGQAHRALGESQAAIRDYTCAIDIIAPMDGLRDYKAQFHFYRGAAYDALGNLEAAINDYTKCLEYWPDYYKCYNNRAIAFLHVGQYKEAIADASTYLAKYKGRATLYCARGLAKLQLGKASAFQDIKKAARMGSKSCHNALIRAGLSE